MKRASIRLKPLLCLLAILLLPALSYGANADLSIPTHFHTPEPPTQTSGVSWFFTVHNDGPDAASNVTVTVTTTGPQTYQGSASPYPFTDNGDGTYSATIGSVSAGADLTFRISFALSAGGAISATAVVSSPDDSNSGNNSATDSAVAMGSPTADLEMTTVTVTPNPGQVGDLRTYQGTLTNLGPDEATNVEVAIQADSVNPQGFGYDAYESFDHSIPPPTTPDPDANGFRYLAVGNIPAGESVTFYAFYHAVQEGSFSRNFLTALSGAEIDPNLNNNHFLVSSTIGAAQGSQADLDPTVAAPSSITVGSNITYTFNTFNLGPDTAQNAVTLFKPSVNESFVSASVPYTIEKGGPSDGYYVVENGDLPLHVGETFTFVFKATKAGPITLTGSAYSDTYDPNGTNDNFDVTTTAAATPTPTPPPHGGLSATSFTVNGSRDATSNVADTVLRFAAAQLATPAGLTVRVQYTTVPGDPNAIWQNLPNGNGGLMAYDPASQQFLLSSLNYPTSSTVAFRAVASASGYPDSVSNVVGNFNLASSKPRLTVPTLNVTANSPFADLYFQTYSSSILSGTSERIQQTTTPYDELSWSNLADGNGGALKATIDPSRFYLFANNIPAGQGMFFRVIASKSGYADGISKATGPIDIVFDKPPTVTALTVSPAGSGSGSDLAHPIALSVNTVTVTVKAQPASGRTIKTLKILLDGATIYSASNAATATYTTGALAIGDHVLEAVAIDDLNGEGRQGTHPTYLRILPGTTTAEKAESSSSKSEAAATTAAPGRAFTVAKPGGDWYDATTWKDASGKSGVPGQNDFVNLGSSTVAIKGGNPPESAYVGALTIDGGKLTGAGSLTIFKHGTIKSATFEGVALSVVSSADCEFINTDNVLFPAVAGLPPGQVVNSGTLRIHGGAGIIGSSSFVNLGTISFEPLLYPPTSAGLDPLADTRAISSSSFSNSGLVSSTLSAIIGENGSGVISNDGGTIVAQGGGNLVNTNGSNLIGQDGNGLIGQDGNGIVAQGGGNIVAQGGGNHQSFAQAEEAAVTGFVQDAGEINLDGVRITGDVTLNGGVIEGTGFIYGNLTNTGGYVSPGHSPGVIAVTGNFTQGAAGSLIVEDGGATPDLFDQLQVGGTATLGGTLDLKLINGYVPSTLDTFSPLSYSSHTGKFATVSANGNATLNASGLLTTVDSTKSGPQSGTTVNISTRAQVQTGDDVLIGGFIVSGPAGATKQVILRGIGPSLSSAGVPGALSDPFIELHDATHLIASNDNWMENKAAVLATKVAPTNNLESALVVTLAPGAYTVILRGAHGETGIGLVEVYDLDPGSAATLANIATRCKVETGDDVMIGGFIVQGSEPGKILLRGIGPSLTKAGVTDALADPMLELHDAQGDVVANNDWEETQQAEVANTTIPPTNAKESAMVLTLTPGAYTVVLRGNNNGTGVGLVEAYDLK